MKAVGEAAPDVADDYRPATQATLQAAAKQALPSYQGWSSERPDPQGSQVRPVSSTYNRGDWIRTSDLCVPNAAL